MSHLVPIEKLGGRIHYLEQAEDLVSAPCVKVDAYDLLRFPQFTPMTRSSDLREFTIDDVVLDGTFHSLRKGGAVVDEYSYGISASHIAANRIYAHMVVNDTSDRPTIIGFNWTSVNYYHWMLQSLPSISVLIEKYGTAGIQLALPPLKAWQEAGLSKLGISHVPRVTLYPDKQYAFKKVLFTDFLHGSAIFTTFFNRHVARLKRSAHLSDCSPRRIYVARTDAEIRRLVNEDQIVSMVKEFGFEVFVPGQHSLDTQIDRLHGADMVVGSHGAGLTNMMFCKQGAVLYEFVKSSYSSSCMNALAQNCNLKYYADFFDVDEDGEGQLQDWSVDVDRVRRRLSSITSR